MSIDNFAKRIEEKSRSGTLTELERQLFNALLKSENENARLNALAEKAKS